MKEYLKECGWKATRMKIEGAYVSFEVRPASRER